MNILSNGLVGKIELTDSTDNRYYYLKDHLGSVRCVVDNNGSVVSAQDYYPYGETIRQFNNNRYMLTEKEPAKKMAGKRDAETGNDYGVYPAIYGGARYYNSKLGVWLQVDPLSEKYPGWSPYNYTLCNPINLIDEYGLETDDPEKKNKEAILPEIIVIGERPQESWTKWAQSVLLARMETKNDVEQTWESIKSGNRYTTPYYLVKSLLSLANLALLESAPLPMPAALNLLPTARQSLLNAVTNSRLKNAINELYRQGAKIGSGSSMDAFRQQGTHGQKLINYRDNLMDIMRSESLSQKDKAILKDILIDIQNAIGGK
ncbi:MAG: RHS repeat-associated core domain-containing protein [Bacteroidota bacterium]